MNKEFNRRKFIKASVGAGLVLSGANMLLSCKEYNAKGLPTSILGNTGVRIPLIAMGLGSRFCTIKDSGESEKILNHAIDNGLYYWDTAHIYKNKKLGVTSEERIGKIMAYRRNEVFLSTKVTERDPDKAKKQIEGSLKRLKTDHLDILKIHDVSSLQDVDDLGKKGHLVEIITRLKEEGVTRFIGFSGHGNAEAMKTMAERYDLDTMLIAMNHWGKPGQERQKMAVPAAKNKGLGVMVMKAIRPKDKDKSLDGKQLIRYALSLDKADGLVLGIDSMDILNENLDLLRNFKCMNESEMEKMTARLEPFFKHDNLSWMKPDYCDGNWA